MEPLPECVGSGKERVLVPQDHRTRAPGEDADGHRDPLPVSMTMSMNVPSTNIGNLMDFFECKPGTFDLYPVRPAAQVSPHPLLVHGM